MYLRGCIYPFLYQAIIEKYGSISLFARELAFRTSKVYRVLKGTCNLGPVDKSKISRLLDGNEEILFQKVEKNEDS